MNIKVAGFTVSEKSINTKIVECTVFRAQYLVSIVLYDRLKAVSSEYCVNVYTLQRVCCMHTQSMDVNEDSDQNLEG